MNKGYVLVVLVAVLVLVEGKTQLKRRNGSKAAANVDRVIESRGGEELLQENSLKAGDKFLDVYQALLQKKAARDARLAKKSERQERKKQALRAAQGEKLQAEAGLDFETYDQAEKFHNLEAEADRNVANRFGLQILSENSHNENAAIKENAGAKAASGTKLLAHEAVNAAMTSDIEALDEGEYADAEGLDAAASDSNALNAQEAANTEREAFIDAQSLNARSGAFSDNFFDDGNFGGASFQPTNSLGFFGGGSGDFFRRRRR